MLAWEFWSSKCILANQISRCANFTFTHERFSRTMWETWKHSLSIRGESQEACKDHRKVEEKEAYFPLQAWVSFDCFHEIHPWTSLKWLHWQRNWCHIVFILAYLGADLRSRVLAEKHQFATVVYCMFSNHWHYWRLEHRTIILS